MVHRLPLTKARINLGALVKRVHLNKEYVVLEKDGIPIAGLMDIQEFEDYLELQDPQVRSDIRASSEEYRAGKGRPAGEFLNDVESTSELMRRLYGHLKAGKSKDDALRKAQVDLIRRAGSGSLDTSHPFHWAAFQLIGDWR